MIFNNKMKNKEKYTEQELIEEPKTLTKLEIADIDNKETLEKAAIGATKIYKNEREKQTAYFEFINGAKWKEEKMYNEEFVLNLIKYVKLLEYMDGSKLQQEFSSTDILKQFKKSNNE